MPRLKENGQLEKKMATYADAMVATAGLLAMAGVPVVGYWSEHNRTGKLSEDRALQLARKIRAEWNSENFGEELVDEEIPAPTSGEPEKVDERRRERRRAEGACGTTPARQLLK